MGIVELRHILGRFVIHFFSAGAIWLMVYRWGAVPLQNWAQEPKILATALMLLVIAIKEIFDAAKLAQIRGDALQTLWPQPLEKHFPETSLEMRRHIVQGALNDPRYTLKKSIIDLISWAAGIALMLVLL